MTWPSAVAPTAALTSCPAPALPLHASPLSRQVLLKIIQPYTRVRIPFIAQKLNIPAPDVEQLLVTLILDGRVAGHIDQVGGWVRDAGGGRLRQAIYDVHSAGQW